MKKIMSLVIILSLFLTSFSFAESEDVTVTIPAFDVTVNGVTIDTEHSQYPIITYKDITYIPMTSDYLAGFGLRSSFNGQDGLSIDVAESVDVLEQKFLGAKNIIGSEQTAEFVPFNVTVNGNRINNTNEVYPILLYKNITYFPMTWRFAVTEFGWKTSWSDASGLSITIDKESFYEVRKIEDLFEVNNNPDDTFKLINDLDFRDIGDYHDTDVYYEYKKTKSLPVELILKGKLDGNGKTISNLTLSRTDFEPIALFEKIDTGAIVQNLKIDNFDMTGKSDVALLVVNNFGTIKNVEVNGSIIGADIMAGIAIHNFYIIQDSSADIDIAGIYSFDVSRSYSGGIVGRNRGVIERVVTNGTISGWNSIGGVVGLNYEVLRNAVSNVNLTSSELEGDYTGGIVGINEGGRIENVIAYGEIIGQDYTGGLVGLNENGTLVNSVAGNESISGARFVGANIGVNRYTDTNTDDYGTYNNYYFSNIPLSGTKINTDSDTMGLSVNALGFINLSQTMSFWNAYKGTPWDFQTIWEIIDNQAQLQD